MSAFAALLLCLAAWLPQGSAGIPKNDGWVTDLAGLVPSARETALEARMESFRSGSSHAEIAVLTVPSLNGEPAERFALETARAWGIGSKATSNGALIVIARDEHEVRIEVGRGLEGEVTDAMAWRVIQQVILPRFRAGDFAGGIEDGVDALHRVIGGDYGAIGGREDRQGAIVGVVLLLILLLFVAIAIRGVKRIGRGFPPIGGGRMGGMGFPIGLGGGRGFSGGGFSGFGGGGGFSGGGASGRW